MRRSGVILFAHGARDARWSAPFEAVAQQVQRQRPQSRVQLAYLEFMTPSLPEAGSALCAAGCTRIEVLPLFLGTGGHLRKDLPPMVQALREQHPQVHWYLHAAVGEHEAVIQAMAAAAVALLPDPASAQGDRA